MKSAFIREKFEQEVRDSLLAELAEQRRQKRILLSSLVVVLAGGVLDCALNGDPKVVELCAFAFGLSLIVQRVADALR